MTEILEPPYTIPFIQRYLGVRRRDKTSIESSGTAPKVILTDTDAATEDDSPTGSFQVAAANDNTAMMVSIDSGAMNYEMRDQDGEMRWRLKDSSGINTRMTLTAAGVLTAKELVSQSAVTITGDLTVSGGDINIGTTAAGETLNVAGVTTASGAGSNLIVKAGDATGTNQAGAYLALKPGMGTGSSNSGDILLQTGPAGSSGTTANTPATVLTAMSSGNIYVTNKLGIGTSSPAVSLDVYGSFYTTAETDQGARWSQYQYTDDDEGPVVFLLKSRGTEASPTQVSDGDEVGTINFSGEANHATINPYFPVRAYIQAHANSIGGGNLKVGASNDGGISGSGALTFTGAGGNGTGSISSGMTSTTSRFAIQVPTSWDSTAPAVYFNNTETAALHGNTLLVQGGANSSSSNTLEVQDLSGNTDFVVRGDGNVGIGTSTPRTQFQVKRGTSVDGSPPSGDWAAEVYHASNASGDNGLLILNNWMATTSTIFEAGSINAGNGAYTSRFKIDGIGNVGIGTVSPLAPLSFANTAGNKIDLYHATASGGDRYGFQVQSSELRIHSGALGNATGGISFGKHTTSTFTEHMRISNGGAVYIQDGNPYAVPYSKMARGSLTIGGRNTDFGVAAGWTANTAGLMLECSNDTSIKIHDADTRLAELMFYDGSAHTIQIGRNVGWGVLGILGLMASTVSIGKTSSAAKALEVYQPSNAAIRVQNSTTGTGTGDGFLVEADGSNVHLWNYESGYVRIGVGNAEKARIASDGKFGCGTGMVAPGAPLDVRNSSYTGDTVMIANSGDSGSSVNECGIAFRHWPYGSHPSARIVIQENGNASWDSHMQFKTKATGTDAAPPTVFTIGAGGQLTSPATWSTTYSASANVYVHSSGALYKATSTGRLKTDIEDVEDVYADAILNLRPVWYRSLCRDDRDDWSHWGLIAEEVAEIDPRLVQYGNQYELDENGNIVYETFPMVDEDGNPVYEQVEQVDDDGNVTYVDGDTQLMDTGGPKFVLGDDGEPVFTPENVQYDRIVPLLLNLVKRQQDRLEHLEATLEEHHA